MYVCICHAVTDKDIDHAVDQGSRSLRDLRSVLGVTDGCGRCGSCAHQCLNHALKAKGFHGGSARSVLMQQHPANG